MTAPQLTQFEPGSPATSLSADQLNTLMQSCDNFTQMRAFVGALGQSLFARGAVTIGDGQQGIFYWASGSAYTDDGVNTIVPTLAFRGAWVRLTSISPSSATYLQTANNLSDVPSKAKAVSNLFTGVSSFSLGQHIATQNIATVTGQGAFDYGTLSYTDNGLPLSLQGSLNGYVQAVVQNSNSGAAASSDFIVSNNLGTASTYYGDFGINSSAFSGSGSFNLPNATYLYAANGDLVVGTYTSNAIHFVVNNGATDAMQISAAGVVSLTNPLALTSGGTGSAVATGAQSNLQYLTAATGGVARTYLSKFGDVCSVKDFGAKGDGTTDDTAAIQAAINSTSGGNLEVIFPPGFYLCGGLTWTSSNRLTLSGMGQALLQLNSTTGSIFSATAGYVLIRDFWAYYPTANTVTAGYFFNFSACTALIERINFLNGYSLAQWGAGCSNSGARDCTAIAMTGNGFTVDVSPSTSGQQYGIMTFSGLNFQGTTSNVGAGIALVSGDTVVISDCNIAGFYIPINMTTSASRSYLANVFLTNVLADGAGGPVSTQPGYIIDGTNQLLARVNMSNCWASSMQSSGMYFKNAKSINLSNMYVIANTGHGLLIDTGVRDLRLTNSVISGNSSASSGSFDGITVLSGANNIHITNCRSGPTYNGTSIGTFNDTQGYGCLINSSSITNYIIQNNDFSGNVSGRLQDLGGGTTGTTKFVGNNILTATAIT